jgi:hypothetical protein
MPEKNLEEIKSMVIAGLKSYLSSLKAMFKGSIYTDASTRFISWDELKLGKEMQQQYLVTYENEYSKQIAKEDQRRGWTTHDHICAWIYARRFDTEKLYNRFSEFCADVHLNSGQISMVVTYGKVIGNLYPFNATFTLKDSGQFIANRGSVPDVKSSDGVDYFDSNDPRGLSTLDLGLIILGNGDMISAEVLNCLRSKEALYKKCMAQHEAERDAEEQRYTKLFNMAVAE